MTATAGPPPPPPWAAPTTVSDPTDGPGRIGVPSPGPPVRTTLPGQLTTAWQIMVGLAWAATFFAMAGVWKASEELGIATWWLGPRADPQPVVVRILPFALALAVGLCAVYNTRFVSWISIAGAVALGVVAAVDLSYMTELAMVEFAIAAAVGLVSLASFGGRYGVPSSSDG